jgi:hypothetical protein
MRNDKDFKPCHVHGAESKHSYDECRHNPKNLSTTNKSSYYVKKVDTMRTTMTINVSEMGTNPQANARLHCQVTGKLMTSQATAIDPPRIIISILCIKLKK